LDGNFPLYLPLNAANAEQLMGDCKNDEFFQQDFILKKL
jgi:hypothetical protein